MVITSSGRTKDDGVRIPVYVDLTHVTYVRDDNDDEGNCVLFYNADLGGSPLPFMPKTTITVCIHRDDVLPVLSPNDWFKVLRIYADDISGVTCYIRLQDIYAYLEYPDDERYPYKTVGLYGAFGNMRVTLDALPAVQAEFARRRVS